MFGAKQNLIHGTIVCFFCFYSFFQVNSLTPPSGVYARLTAAVFRPAFPAIPVEGFANHLDGFSTLIRWLSTQGARAEQAVVCLEATGVYGEALCYFLQAQGYAVAVEAPQRVKRAFHQLGKNDRVDAQQIAEYAYRFEDALAFGSPPKPPWNSSKPC